MNAIDSIASAQGCGGDQPNIDLAQRLVDAQDSRGVADIVGGLCANAATASDCIKVLYEIGYRRPALIAPYADEFLSLLRSKNNRMVWGAMAALGSVTALASDRVFAQWDTVLAAYESGSVITRDHAVSVFAALCGANAAYEKQVMPVLAGHFQTCRAKEIPQHFERVCEYLHGEWRKPIDTIVQARFAELSPSQQARVRKRTNKPGEESPDSAC